MSESELQKPPTDEDLFSRDAALADRLADLGLVLVVPRGVYVPVVCPKISQFSRGPALRDAVGSPVTTSQSGETRRRALVVLEDAQSKDGHLVTCIEASSATKFNQDTLRLRSLRGLANTHRSGDEPWCEAIRSSLTTSRTLISGFAGSGENEKSEDPGSVPSHAYILIRGPPTGAGMIDEPCATPMVTFYPAERSTAVLRSRSRVFRTVTEAKVF